MTQVKDHSRIDPPRTADQVIVLANPRAGARSGRPAVLKLVETLESHGLSAEVVEDAQRLFGVTQSSLNQQRLRAVVAAGGDGTLGLALNQTPVGTPLTVLPLGTENLLSKYLGIESGVKKGPHSVFEAILHGKTVCLDAGAVGDRLFLLMLSCGFDAEVVRRLHEGRRGNIRHLSYLKPFWDAFRSYRYPPLRVTYSQGDGSSEDFPTASIDARWLFIQNLPCYAMGLQFVPTASGHDGRLDFCAFEKGSFYHGMRYLGGVLAGRHQRQAGCIVAAAVKMRIESESESDNQVPYQIDGDHAGFLPIEVRVVPRRITLITPPSCRLSPEQ